MDLEHKAYCHWDLVRLVGEEDLKIPGGFMTLSVTDGSQYELMLFLGMDDACKLFEVRVYKAEPTQVYVKNEKDRVLFYEENDEYATFSFDNYDDAHDFIDNLSYRHQEYLKRPVREIRKEE